MEPLLYLVHRLPYPPNKGDKIRSFQLLKYLGRRFRVHLGTFVDDTDDEQYVDEVRAHCAGLYVERLSPMAGRLKSALALLGRRPLTLAYYRSAGMRNWVSRTIMEHRIRRAFVFCSSMSQYVEGRPELQAVTDFVDVDSAKWVEYAKKHRWPMSAIYRREGRALLEFERAAAAASSAAIFCTPAEVALFRRLAPECEPRLRSIRCGVDADFFRPDPVRDCPYVPGGPVIAFTGAMDYWPNADAACWFAKEVLPRIAARVADVRFCIVGMNPTAAVRALAIDPRIVVTGKVPDVRPYLQHAALVVAPLRIARGVQNKVLEAMAAARPVIVSRTAAGGISAELGTEVAVADGAEEFEREATRLLGTEEGERMGARARARIESSYDWDSSLASVVELLEEAAPALPASGRSLISNLAPAG